MKININYFDCKKRSQIKKITLYSLILLILLISNSCSNTSDVTFDEDTFYTQKAEWESLNISNYNFTQNYFNDTGPQPHIMNTIKSNELVSSQITDEDLESGEWNSNDLILDNLVSFNSINAIYEYIEELIENEKIKITTQEINGFYLNIVFDNTYHYPTNIEFSTTYYNDVVGGDYFTLVITDFNLVN
jgi:hypothetical protein